MRRERDFPETRDGQQSFGGALNEPSSAEHPIHGPPWTGEQEPARIIPPTPVFLTQPQHTDKDRSLGDSQVIWRRIESELHRRDLTIKQLSQDAGIARRTLLNFRRGATDQISRRVLTRLCAYFGWDDPYAIRMEGPHFRAEMERLDEIIMTAKKQLEDTDIDGDR